MRRRAACNATHETRTPVGKQPRGLQHQNSCGLQNMDPKCSSKRRAPDSDHRALSCSATPQLVNRQVPDPEAFDSPWSLLLISWFPGSRPEPEPEPWSQEPRHGIRGVKKSEATRRRPGAFGTVSCGPKLENVNLMSWNQRNRTTGPRMTLDPSQISKTNTPSGKNVPV